MTSENAAPAEMPGVEEIAHILMTHTGLQFATQGDAERLKQRLEAAFSAITQEKEAAIKVAETNATAGAFWVERGKSAEARALSAEASLAELRKQMRADEGQHRDALAAERERAARIVLDWQKQLSPGEMIDWHAERVAAAIRAQGE